MPALRGLLFDVGGTLVSNSFAIGEGAFQDLCLQRLTAAFGTELPWFRPLISHEFPQGGVDARTLRQDVAGEVTRFLATIGVTIEPGTVATVGHACAVPLPALFSLLSGAEAAVREARAMGLRLAICSNTFWRDDEDIAADWRAFGLADCFDAYVSSPSTGYVKPHPAMFQRALASIDVAPSETAIVGDRVREDIEGGHAAGLRTIWMRQPGTPDPSGLKPDAVIGSLDELGPVLRAWSAQAGGIDRSG